MSNAFLQAIKVRRSIYAIGSHLPISEEKITEIVTTAVKQSPSSFNSQSSRAVILFGAQHKKLWDIVKHQLQKSCLRMLLSPPKKTGLICCGCRDRAVL